MVYFEIVLVPINFQKNFSIHIQYISCARKFTNDIVAMLLLEFSCFTILYINSNQSYQFSNAKNGNYSFC